MKKAPECSIHSCMDGSGGFAHIGIRQLALHAEKLLADYPAAEKFIVSFEELMEDNQYTLQQNFSNDKTGFYY